MLSNRHAVWRFGGLADWRIGGWRIGGLGGFAPAMRLLVDVFSLIFPRPRSCILAGTASIQSVSTRKNP
jgi:hypothetical protein